ncbi:MAG: VanZ family protein, partial [Anaerolineales bacterium]
MSFSLREWSLSILLLLVVLFILRRRGHSWAFLLLFGAFWLYLTFLVSVAFFPIPPQRNSLKRNFRQTMRRIQWAPFGYLTNPNISSRLIYAEIIGNIEATLPFGIFLPWLWPRLRKAMPWLIWLPGLGIEMVQFLLSIIFGPYRTVDSSDVILNAIGVASGYWLFSLSELLFHSKWQTPKRH